MLWRAIVLASEVVVVLMATGALWDVATFFAAVLFGW
jgi:hypothetical protein